MTFDEFMEKVLDAFPDAAVGETPDSELIIYTNLVEVNGQVVTIEEEGS